MCLSVDRLHHPIVHCPNVLHSERDISRTSLTVHDHGRSLCIMRHTSCVVLHTSYSFHTSGIISGNTMPLLHIPYLQTGHTPPTPLFFIPTTKFSKNDRQHAISKLNMTMTVMARESIASYGGYRCFRAKQGLADIMVQSVLSRPCTRREAWNGRFAKRPAIGTLGAKPSWWERSWPSRRLAASMQIASKTGLPIRDGSLSGTFWSRYLHRTTRSWRMWPTNNTRPTSVRSCVTLPS